ncbi:NrfD/PsrC family molybdoenzyme membrane anchor subunit [Granulicella rosea]|uniref:NrfD/PsrC family molybdoenzyme membrane anchor subunit n=1 Tax=Granulicella rosea TaxID=474952 RepID=UPI0015963947|nr:Ni/Fe-hydrogenase cytochrome b subunit [Granulicella rosea]
MPVTTGPVLTPLLALLMALAAIGLILAGVRVVSPLAPFSSMNSVYAWGIWKTFNVMTLTALGSGPLALGMAAWVFNRQKLHVVMRTALVSGFLFYATGLIALGFDVGRPWNFYSAAMPWRWNTSSAMLEISICMPLYCAVFLSFEILPLFLERLYYTGNEKARAFLRHVSPLIRKIYPFAIIGAYVIPLMHQSSLGGLLLLAGDKIHPLWQSPVMPWLYLVAAALCGFAFTIFLLLIVCLRYARRLDGDVLAELANLLSGMCFLFLAIQAIDLIWRGQIHAAFAFDKMSLLFLLETSLILTPAVALRFRRVRQTPRALLNMSALACLGGMLYRFIPTSIAYAPMRSTSYFPSVPELVMAVGYISLGIVAFVFAINYFAVLPGEASTWDHAFRPFGWKHPTATQATAIEREA